MGRSRSVGVGLVDLWSLGQYVDQLVRLELARHGESGELLAVLAAVAERPLTTSELAAALGEPYMTVSDQVDRLVARDELRREPHPGDRRAKLISLTGAGDRRLRRTGPHIRSVERSIREHLSFDPARVAEVVADLRRAVELAVVQLETGA